MHKKDLISIIYLTILTIAALVYGFMTIPSPVTQRKVTFDHRRVSDLGEIKSSVEDYYRQYAALPASLEDLKSTTYGASPTDTKDPETNVPYAYSVISKQPPYIQLCATFTTDSRKDDPAETDTTNYEWQTYMGDYQHPQGKYCFKLHIGYASIIPSAMPVSTTPIRMHPMNTPSKANGE